MAPMRSMARYGGYAQPLAHRGGVHPHERPPGLAVRAPPRAQPLHHLAARLEPAGDLLVEPGRERKGAPREAQAEPVYEGRARHQAPVLLRYTESSTARNTSTGAFPSSSPPSM